MQFAAQYLLVLRLLFSVWTIPGPVLNVHAAEIVPDTPVSLSIPAINLDTELESVGLTSQQLTAVPDTLAGWYNLSVKPGERGTAVMVGHTPGVFNSLNSLEAGDQILVTDSHGTVFTYTVNRLIWYKTEDFPVQTVYGSSGGYHLNLITCAGDAHRLVVFGEIK
jgi:LPXTG-site transpeptidase (sortase) family protein